MLASLQVLRSRLHGVSRKRNRRQLLMFPAEFLVAAALPLPLLGLVKHLRFHAHHLPDLALEATRGRFLNKYL
ncbi:hypothetical protein CBY09_09550 [Acidovorax kalamii]|uniref:Uncharacterized protein n=1 Tax=Acidovorax kalamii TaxID=2004485 RepID=A0A235EP14_9BURK|nr:hypothetical protein CBY09_09550 [Acidovorax kalamii]